MFAKKDGAREGWAHNSAQGLRVPHDEHSKWSSTTSLLTADSRFSKNQSEPDAARQPVLHRKMFGSLRLLWHL